MPHAVTITGTRSTDHRPLGDYRTLFEEYLHPFARSGVRFYIGGARGIDSLSLLWLSSETEALVTVAVPAKVADQPSDARLAIAKARESGRLELVELDGETKTAGYHARNRWMVDRSEFVIGFPKADARGGGTDYTLDYAAGQNKPHLVVPI